MPEATIPSGMTSVADILVAVAKVPSKGEAKRLIQGGGISVDNEKVTDIMATVTDEQLKNGFVLQKGKKNFYKVTVE
jgi:tyrosyl-tRNA synthetase